MLQGSISGNLTVAAGGAPGLTWQWYQCLGSVADPLTDTRITGANSSTFTLPSTLTEGTYRYYCVVAAPGAISVTSNVATVTVISPATITITTQPVASTSVIETLITGSLGMAASVSPGRTMIYQWYSNSSSSNAGGTAIVGATSASYTIPTTLTSTGGDGSKYYYFCEVTATGAPAVLTALAVVNVFSKSLVETVDISDSKYDYPNEDDISADINAALSLVASLPDKTVTVIGTRTIADRTTSTADPMIPLIEIPSGVTLRWQASLTGSTVDDGAIPFGPLVHIEGSSGGDGEFEMAGGKIENTGVGIAVFVGRWNGVNLTVSGGEITGSRQALRLNRYAEVRVSGTGRIETKSALSGRAIFLVESGNKVTVSGGEVKSAGGTAIYSGDGGGQTVLISGGAVNASGNAIQLGGPGNSITVSGGNITSDNSVIYLGVKGLGA